MGYFYFLDLFSQLLTRRGGRLSTIDVKNVFLRFLTFFLFYKRFFYF